MNDSTQNGLALVLQERLWGDHEAGSIKPLQAYLDLYPGQDELVAAEYLTALSEIRGNDENADGDRNDGDLHTIASYSLVRELGRGGQGVVWLAEDTRLGRMVALKVLTGLGPGAEQHLARFKREAAIALKLDHPGICAVHDAGIDNGIPYIAMRHVEGETLAQMIGRIRGDLAADSAETFFVGDASLEDESETVVETGSNSNSQASSMTRRQVDDMLLLLEKSGLALHEAHEAGIVHRDIKPGNIMVGKDGQPVILDFGLARDDSEDAGASLTMTGDFLGTPAYMSPEQIAGQQLKLDRRTDVYSLGVTLFECLTLKRPFEAPTREGLYQSIMYKELPDPRRLNRSISRDLRVVLECALDKDRDKRYQTAADFARDLARVREGLPIAAKPIGPVGKTLRWARRRPFRAATVAALILGLPLLAGLGGYIAANAPKIRAQEQAEHEDRVERLLARGFYELHHVSHEEARDTFTQAAEMEPGSVEAVGGIAMACLAMKRPESAERGLARFSKLPPELLSTRVRVLRALERDEEADAIAATEPTTSAGFQLAAEHTMTEAHDVGIDTLEGRALLRRAKDQLARAIAGSRRARLVQYLSYAHVLMHLPEDGTKSPIVQSLVRNWPDEPYSWLWSYNVEDPETALEHVARAEAIEGAPNCAALRTTLYTRLGRFEEAEAAAAEALREEPDAAMTHHNLAALRLQQERYEETLAAAERALELNSGREGIHPEAVIASALTSLGRIDEAIPMAEELVAKYPLDSRLHHTLGKALAAGGRPAEALPHLDRALELDPDSLLTIRSRGDCFMLMGQAKEAIPILEEAEKRGGGNVSLFVNLGAAYGMVGRDEDAIAVLKRAIALAPDTPQPYVNLAYAHAKVGDTEAMKACAEKAIEIDPKLDKALGLLAQVKIMDNDLDGAIEFQKRASAANPKNFTIHSNLAAMLARAKRNDEALEAYALALDCPVGPNDRFRAQTMYFYAVALGQAGRVDECMAMYRRTIELDPTYAEAYCNLGDWHRQREEWEEAARLIRKGHEIGSARENWPYPSKTWLQVAMRNRARVLMGTNPEREVECWRELLEFFPEDTFALRTFSFLLCDEEKPAIFDPKAGLEVALRVVEMTGRDDPWTGHVLARALHARGFSHEALAVQDDVLAAIEGGAKLPFPAEAARAARQKYADALASPEED